jgi:multiple sugar transport system ATP-binding protein
MSGGQRQRVAVSRAIVIKPKIFLMDEPLSNLDAKLRVTMRTELKRIHTQENSTTIFVTHDQAEAMSLADRIIVMYQGKIEQIGTPMEVYRNSATRFVASFIGTPPTNFFDVCVEKDAEGFAAVHPAFRYRTPPALNSALAAYAGKEIVLGIRPEFIGASPKMEKTASYLCDTTIDFAEPQGSYSILITHVGGEEIKIVSSDFTEISAGTPVSLNVREGEAMFFDPGTGLRIR